MTRRTSTPGNHAVTVLLIVSLLLPIFSTAAIAAPKIEAGWQITQAFGETWLYNPATTFFSPYGTLSPYEDWATSWEAYFYGDLSSSTPDPCNVWMQTNMFLKCAIVHQILG